MSKARFYCFLIGLWMEIGDFGNVNGKVFSTNGTLFDLSQTHSLESFIHWNDNSEQPNLSIKTLKLALKIEQLANRSAADNQDFYHMASGHLKKLLPNLKEIELCGGHIFYPGQGDNTKLKSEIQFLAYSIESIWKAFRYVDVVVRPLTYKLALIFNREALADTNLKEFLSKSFGHESAIHHDVNQTKFTIINDAHKNHLDIRLHILTDLEAIRKNTGLQNGRIGFSEAEREFYKIPGSGFNEQIFIPGKKLVYRTIYSPLYLEDFIKKVNIKAQNELEKLTINLLIYPLANKTSNEISEGYKKAVINLKKAAPNLHHIDLMGGHSLMKQNGTSKDIEFELNLLKNGLNAIVQAFADQNLNLHSVIMQLFMVFPEEAFVNFNSTIFDTLLANNQNPINITSIPGLIVIDKKLPNDVEIRLELSSTTDFQSVQSMTNLQEGYSEDFTAASMFSNLDMSYIKGDLQLHDWQ